MLPFSQLFTPFPNHLDLLQNPRRRETIAVEWIGADGAVFFRPKGGDVELVWCDLAYKGLERVPIRANRVTQLLKRLSRAYHSRVFSRVIPFPFQDLEKVPNEWLLLRRNRALVKSTRQKEAAHFECPIELKGDALKWASQPLSFYQQAIQEKLDSNDADLQEARECAVLDEQQAIERTISWVKGSRTEWEKLSHALLVLSFKPEEDRPRYYTIDGQPFPGKLALQTSHWRLPYHWSHPQPQLNLPRAASLLSREFVAHSHPDRWRRAHESGRKTTIQPPLYTVEVPSQHDILEALMLWRDWLREVATEEERRAVLAELSSANRA